MKQPNFQRPIWNAKTKFMKRSIKNFSDSCYYKTYFLVLALNLVAIKIRISYINNIVSSNQESARWDEPNLLETLREWRAGKQKQIKELTDHSEEWLFLDRLLNFQLATKQHSNIENLRRRILKDMSKNTRIINVTRKAPETPLFIFSSKQD